MSATVLLLSLGACGDNVGGDGLQGGTDDIEPNGNGDNVPRYVPRVCSVNEWSPTVADGAVNLSVVPRPTGGATLLSVPQAGGSLVGFNLDPRMDMIGDPTKVAIDGTYDHVTASYVGGRPVSTMVSDGAVYIHMLDDDLGSPQYITKIPGSHIAEPAFFHAQGNLVMPVVNDTGLWMHRFDDSLEPIDAKHFKTTAPGTSISVSQLGTALMTSWSTDTECYMHVNTTYEAGVTAKVDTACPDPRIAVNQNDGEGVMLFDSPEGIRMMTLHTTMMGGDARVIRPDANSPRTLFDGTNFWVSYLDARGDVVVGFLDAEHNPITMSLGAPQPQRQGYELVEIEGSPWVFSADGDGYTAYRMCVEAVL